MTERRDARTRLLLTCGLIAGPLFTAAWIVEGATRAGYDPWRHPVSSLSIGDLGWTQVVNFEVTGLLTLAFSAGLWLALRPLGGSTWGPLLIAGWGVGLLGAGAFATDPALGYPPGSPAVPSHLSVHGALHQAFSTLFFAGLPAACFVFTRRFAGWGERRWAIYSAATAIAFIAAFALTSASIAQAPGLVGLAGLFQRVALVVGWLWPTLLAAHLLAKRPG